MADLLNFEGKWLTEDGRNCLVISKYHSMWVGYITIGTLKMPTWWDLTGTSVIESFSLKERIRDYVVQSTSSEAVPIPNVLIEEPTLTENPEKVSPD